MSSLQLPVGAGYVELHPDDAAPVAFHHPDRPTSPWLLQEGDEAWHTAAHRWGRGFAITDRGSFRWGAPHSIDTEGNGIRVRHRIGADLELEVERAGGVLLTESYTLRNTAERTVTVGSLAVSTPWRDLYTSATDSLERACHAHVWTGGSWAWVLAEPMDGAGPLLGLILRSGELWSYSIESRNVGTGSNVRGHVLLNVTDRARNAAANGGQPSYRIEPGEALGWRWEVGFHPDRAAFLAATDPPARLTAFCAEAGRPIVFHVNRGMVAEVAGVTHRPDDAGAISLVGAGRGERHVDLTGPGIRARTALLWTDPLPSLVRRRVSAVLRRHRDPSADGLRRFAFVALDSESGLPVHAPDWPDTSDGAERVGMAVLVQQARRLGWMDAAVADPALAGYAEFARTHLVRADGTVLRGSLGPYDGSRLYDYPWLAHFFADHYAMFGNDADLAVAVAILTRLADRGGTHFLSIGWAEATARVAALLIGAGRRQEGDAIEEPLRRSAAWFAAQGTDLPAHEVNYEQTVVAPLVSLLARYGDLDDEAHHAALGRAVCWLTAFGGPQPHVRLNSVPIRHWDGYWFGRERMWGDTFPHYWSIVTAVALAALPAEMQTDALRDHAARIRDAVLVDVAGSDTPTCAFVFPSCVDGRPGFRPDPISNDQDWALALVLRDLPE